MIAFDAQQKLETVHARHASVEKHQIEPVRLREPLSDYPFSRTYIKATEEPRPADGAGARPSPFWRAADQTKTDPAWRYREIDTDHMILVNRPAELVELLLELT